MHEHRIADPESLIILLFASSHFHTSTQVILTDDYCNHSSMITRKEKKISCGSRGPHAPLFIFLSGTRSPINAKPEHIARFSDPAAIATVPKIQLTEVNGPEMRIRDSRRRGLSY